jgi:2,3-bisphosphoglycerate-dependent phosphoglycerate mutase
MSGRLILVRHTESTDNHKGRWSGIRNVSLTKKGRADARKMGTALRDQQFDVIYVSQLKRTKQTLREILAAYGPTKAIIKKTGAIDERDYGLLAGKDKWKVRAAIGVHAWTDIRRGWDVPVPDGETLKDVYERIVPWYREIVLPQLLRGKNIMLVGHGNSNRALRKYLEHISNEAVRLIEMDFDKARIYEVNSRGYAVSHITRRIKTDKTTRY